MRMVCGRPPHFCLLAVCRSVLLSVPIPLMALEQGTQMHDCHKSCFLYTKVAGVSAKLLGRSLKIASSPFAGNC